MSERTRFSAARRRRRFGSTAYFEAQDSGAESLAGSEPGAPDENDDLTPAPAGRVDTPMAGGPATAPPIETAIDVAGEPNEAAVAEDGVSASEWGGERVADVVTNATEDSDPDRYYDDDFLSTLLGRLAAPDALEGLAASPGVTEADAYDERLPDGDGGPSAAPSPRPLPAVVELADGPSELTDPPPRADQTAVAGKGRGRPRWRVILAATVAAVAALGTVVGIAATRSGGHTAGPAVPAGLSAASSGAASAPASAAPSAGGTSAADVPVPLDVQRQQLQAWMQASISPVAVVVADPRTAGRLRAAGFTGVRADDALAGLDWHGVDYLVSVPTLDTVSATRTALRDASAAVAVFSAGIAAVTVAQVFPAGTADLAARRSNNLAARQVAASQLPKNPNLQFTDAARPLIAQAQLDLRAASVLVVLAQSGTTWVREIAEDPAETRAGQPARTMTVTVADSQYAQTVLAGLPTLYRPQSVTVISQGTLRLIWMPAVAAVVTDGG